MPRFLADHNFKEQIRDGVHRRVPVEITTARQLGLDVASDEDLLAIAAASSMVILTHDHRTLVPAAWQRVEASEPMAGVVLVPWSASIGRSVDALVALFAYTADEDWANRVFFLDLAPFAG